MNKDERKETAEAFVDAVNHPTCRYMIDFENRTFCGAPAVCVIKTMDGGKLLLKSDDDTMGRGVGSTWEPMCEKHRHDFPDHEGFELNGSQKLS